MKKLKVNLGDFGRAKAINKRNLVPLKKEKEISDVDELNNNIFHGLKTCRGHLHVNCDYYACGSCNKCGQEVRHITE